MFRLVRFAHLSKMCKLGALFLLHHSFPQQPLMLYPLYMFALYLASRSVIADATCLTQAGYVGEDVESILFKLYLESGQDVERCQRGIVYIDEVSLHLLRYRGILPSPCTFEFAAGHEVQSCF